RAWRGSGCGRARALALRAVARRCRIHLFVADALEFPADFFGWHAGRQRRRSAFLFFAARLVERALLVHHCGGHQQVGVARPQLPWDAAKWIAVAAIAAGDFHWLLRSLQTIYSMLRRSAAACATISFGQLRLPRLRRRFL